MTTKALPDPKNPYEKAQRVVIGHALNYPSTAEDLFTRLGASDAEAFSHPLLRAAFDAERVLYDRGLEPSIDGIAAEAKKAGHKQGTVSEACLVCMEAADEEYGAQELGRTHEDYVRALRQGHQLKRLKEAVDKVGDYEAAMRAFEEVLSLDAGPVDRYRRSVRETVENLIEIQVAVKAGQREEGYSWGIPALDESLLIQPGRLYTVAGQKGSGKTKFLISALLANLFRERSPVPCLFFSVEMSDIEIVKYMVSHRAGIDSSLILRKTLPDHLIETVEEHGRALWDTPLTIDSSPYLMVRDIVSRIRQWKLKHKIPDQTGIVGVDFMQRILLDRQGGQLSEATALREVAYELSRAAKALGVAIIALAQLNKQADGERPHIGYIEGSGGPGQASDGVLLLDLLRLRDDDEGRRGEGMDELDIILAKVRDGESRVTVPCLADLRTGRFHARSDRETPGRVR